MIELIGVFATILLIISFICNGEEKIRIINSAGALLFVIYGVLIGAWSTAISNLIIIIINVSKLLKGE